MADHTAAPGKPMPLPEAVRAEIERIRKNAPIRNWRKDMEAIATFAMREQARRDAEMCADRRLSFFDLGAKEGAQRCENDIRTAAGIE